MTPMVVALAMSLNPASVIVNALRLVWRDALNDGWRPLVRPGRRAAIALAA